MKIKNNPAACPVAPADGTGVNPACPVGAKHRTGVKKYISLHSDGRVQQDMLFKLATALIIVDNDPKLRDILA